MKLADQLLRVAAVGSAGEGQSQVVLWGSLQASLQPANKLKRIKNTVKRQLLTMMKNTIDN